MTMIKCPKCSVDISDQSSECVHCGYVLEKKSKDGRIVCKECGEELSVDDSICSKCGCPVKKEKTAEISETQVNGFSNEKKRKIIVTIAFFVVIIVLVRGMNYFELKAESNYYRKNFEEISYKMLNDTADAEECGNLLRKVWYNSIFKTSDSETDSYTKKNEVFNKDFNESIDALYSDSAFSIRINGIKANQNIVNKLMIKLKNPPREWEDAYDDLKEYYNNYLTFTNLVINPSGSLQTYTSSLSKADSDIVNSYVKVKAYLD